MPEKCLTCLTDQWVCLRKAGHWNTLLSNLWNRYSVPASFSICSRCTGWSLIKVAELRHLFIYACGRWKIKMKACNKLACDSNFWGWKLAETKIKKCLHSKKKKKACFDKMSFLPGHLLSFMISAAVRSMNGHLRWVTAARIPAVRRCWPLGLILNAHYFVLVRGVGDVWSGISRGGLVYKSYRKWGKSLLLFCTLQRGCA